MPCVKYLSIWSIDIEWSDLILCNALDSAHQICHRVSKILKNPNCSTLFGSCQKDLNLGAYRALGSRKWRDRETLMIQLTVAGSSH